MSSKVEYVYTACFYDSNIHDDWIMIDQNLNEEDTATSMFEYLEKNGYIYNHEHDCPKGTRMNIEDLSDTVHMFATFSYKTVWDYAITKVVI